MTSDKINIESDIEGIGGIYDHLGLSTIHTGLQQLKYFKKIGSSSKPKELDWEIKLYEWILAQPDAKQKSYEYLRARAIHGGSLLPKRRVIKNLGWKI